MAGALNVLVTGDRAPIRGVVQRHDVALDQRGELIGRHLRRDAAVDKGEVDLVVVHADRDTNLLRFQCLPHHREYECERQ